MLSLTMDVGTEAVAGLDCSKSQINQISQSFLEAAAGQERNVPVTAKRGDESLRVSLDPFKLSERLKLVERIERLVQETVESMDADP